MSVNLQIWTLGNPEHGKTMKAVRALIYQKGYVVNSTHVDDLIKADSLVPTEVSIAVFSSQTPLSKVIFRMLSLNDYTNSDSMSLI